MKKLLFALVLLIAFGSAFGQKFDGYVVTNANDTIRCKFFVQTNLLTKTMFYSASVYKSVKIQNEIGEKVKYTPKDLKCFYIKGTTDGNFTFVSFKEDGFKHFYHEVVKDRLSYYRLYNKVGVPVPNGIYKEFIYKDNSFLELGMFNTRKNLASLIQDNKEIYDKWTAENSYYKPRDAFNIINQYNDSYKKKI